VSRVLFDAENPTDGHLSLTLQLDLARYQYPGFTLLPSRDSAFASIGLAWQR
jgi:hypothetical protein